MYITITLSSQRTLTATLNAMRKIGYSPMHVLGNTHAGYTTVYGLQSDATLEDVQKALGATLKNGYRLSDGSE